MMFLAIANGGLRDSLYKQPLGDLAAHQVSTILLLAPVHRAFPDAGWTLASDIVLSGLDGRFDLVVTSPDL